MSIRSQNSDQHVGNGMPTQVGFNPMYCGYVAAQCPLWWTFPNTKNAEAVNKQCCGSTFAASQAHTGCAQTGMCSCSESIWLNPGAAALCRHGWTACSPLCLLLLAAMVSRLYACFTHRQTHMLSVAEVCLTRLVQATEQDALLATRS